MNQDKSHPGKNISSPARYPGVDKIKTKIVSRSLDTSRNESIGFGFMRKNGVTIDEENFRFSKYALVYVIRGTGEYVDPNSVRYPLSPGSIFQRHPGVKHSTFLDPDSDWCECFIDFGPGLYTSLVAYKIIQPEKFVYKTTPDKTIEREFFSLMGKLEYCGEAELPYIVSESISFLTRLIRRRESVIIDEMDILIDKSCVRFTRNPEKRIDLHTFCEKNGVGYENFRKHFRTKVGISPGRYIINRRIDAACEMLRISKTPINEIAFTLGYASPFEFSAQFKKAIGISPKQYRR